MRKSLRDWWSTRWWFFVAGIAVVAVSLTAWQFAHSNSSKGSASGGSNPVCLTTQLRLSIGPTRLIARGREQTARLTLTNTSATCDLDGDAPLIQAVRAPRIAVGRQSVSDGVARAPVALVQGASAYSQISVVALPSPYSRTCRPTTTTGLVVTDGAPARSNRYLSHVFHSVCSNRLRLNVGAGLYATSS